ncbi:hypothetical protein SLA_2568 [Streptomyces laurentii]|uniref:Uncharacterized protein n=1 Tax=Streptomyces laurentii TaxID=39478 RepID=A0A169NFH7_STRLU|nr:hypothetical protein SLA_2568 [Streptomyces laurentii]
MPPAGARGTRGRRAAARGVSGAIDKGPDPAARRTGGGASSGRLHPARAYSSTRTRSRQTAREVRAEAPGPVGADARSARNVRIFRMTITLSDHPVSRQAVPKPPAGHTTPPPDSP